MITDTKVGDMKPVFDKKTKRMRHPKWLRVTLGDHRPKVTATFFNAEWMIEKLPDGHPHHAVRRGEVLQGHHAVDSSGLSGAEVSGRQGDRNKVAEDHRRDASGATGDELLSAFERDFFPIYAANSKVQSWDIYACVRQVLDVLDPVPETLPESFVREHNLISEDEALRAIHLAETAVERDTCA